MSGNTYKIIELVGCSKNTMEDAVRNALSQASESLRHFKWFEVTQIRGKVENTTVAEWQILLKLAFGVERGGTDERAAEKETRSTSGR